MSDRSGILLHTFMLYMLTMALGILTAWRHALEPALASLPPLEFDPISIATFLVVFIAFTFIVIRFARTAQVSLTLLLIITLLAGAHFVATPWLSWPFDILAAGALALLIKVIPRVAVHDVGMSVAIAGVASLLGLSLTPLLACGLLVVLSFYDIISVYRTQHMAALAVRMVRSGAVFGFIVPAKVRMFGLKVDDALERPRVMMLGSGDIGLPLVLATSLATTSLNAGMIVGIFSLGGLMLMQWMFTHQQESYPMAALPPIAAFSILGYAVATLAGV
jgi:presenilin-like A22 family membrane protease